MTIMSESAASIGSSQYSRFWRWHFYAAFLVIPFILWQGVTGVIYLWHQDISDAVWPELRFVSVGEVRASLDEQLNAAIAANAGTKPKIIKISAEANRSTQFIYEHVNGLSSPTFVDPYTGKVLGSVSSTTWLPGLTRELHGGWPLGKPGSWLLELGACWCLVMVLTGLYLWWPRKTKGMGGVLYPRLRAGSRVFWKDLHSVIGMWFSILFLAFLITALPWTDFWGKQVLKPIQQMTGQMAPAALGFSHHAENASMHAGHAPVSFQRVLAIAYAEGLNGDLEMRLKAAGEPITVVMKQGRAANERTLQIDPAMGQVIARVSWKDYPILPKAISTGVDLHEGTFFGRANQIFNSLVVFALFWLIFTGFMGWYKRRPGKGLSAPAASQRKWPRWLPYVAIALCLLMPLLGLSVLLVWLMDR
ncbi:MAG: PepSY-associated TM helix domain-containing protein, partial [Arenimonas sp.]